MRDPYGSRVKVGTVFTRSKNEYREMRVTVESVKKENKTPIEKADADDQLMNECVQ